MFSHHKRLRNGVQFAVTYVHASCILCLVNIHLTPRGGGYVLGGFCHGQKKRSVCDLGFKMIVFAEKNLSQKKFCFASQRKKTLTEKNHSPSPLLKVKLVSPWLVTHHFFKNRFLEILSIKILILYIILFDLLNIKTVFFFKF